MGKHMIAKAHIAKLNQLTELEVAELSSSMVDETALVILKRQGIRGITIVSLQQHIIFDRQNIPNGQLRTLKRPNFTKIRGIAT
jgi:uridylate kinase